MERQRCDIENTRQEIEEFVTDLDEGQQMRELVWLIDDG